MTKFGQKFCSKHPLKQIGGGLGNQAGKIKPINPPNPNSVDNPSMLEKIIAPNFKGSDTMIGSSGPFGVIGGGGVNLAKAAFNIAKNPKILANTLSSVKSFGGAIKNLIKKYKGSQGGSSNIKPLVTGNKVYDTKSINKAFESRFGKPDTKPKKPFIDKAFDAFGETAVQYKDKLPWK